jgi:hypothetical protein
VHDRDRLMTARRLLRQPVAEVPARGAESVGQLDEAAGVEEDGVRLQQVPGRPGEQDAGGRPCPSLRLEQPSQVRHVGLQPRLRLSRRAAVPELVDERVDGHDGAGMDGQQGELLRRPEVERPPVRVDPDRPEHQDVHRRSVGRRAVSG